VYVSRVQGDWIMVRECALTDVVNNVGTYHVRCTGSCVCVCVCGV